MNEVEIQFTKKRKIRNGLLKRSDKIGSKKKYSIYPVNNYSFAAVWVLKKVLKGLMHEV